MMPYMTNEYGNPGSVHQLGRRAASAVNHAREQVAAFLGAASVDQVVFTSGGTEGNNLVFAGLADSLKQSGKSGIIISAIEHDSVRRAANRLCRQHNFVLSVIQPDREGIVGSHEVTSQAELENAALVSVMSANNELGTVNPVYGICVTAHRAGAMFHTDAVQAAGMFPLNAYQNQYDFMTVSSHKIHGPKGVGALYVRDRTLLSPLICGGAEQEFGLRGGTENVAGIVGFGKACELAGIDYELRNKHRRTVTDCFLQTLIREVGGADKFYVNGDPPLDFKSISLRFDGVDAESLILMLDACGVMVSAGSACRSHESLPSHVLTAIGLKDEEARNSIRVSFSDMNTLEDAKEAAEKIAQCVQVLHEGAE